MSASIGCCWGSRRPSSVGVRSRRSRRNAKVTEGRQHQDRDAQFTYLAGQVGEHIGAGQPVISVDTKKKLRHEVARSE